MRLSDLVIGQRMCALARALRAVALSATEFKARDLRLPAQFRYASANAAGLAK